RLAKQTQGIEREHASQSPGNDDLFCFLDQRAVSAMMPHQHWYAGLLGGLHELQRGSELIRDRLLHQHRDAGSNRHQAMRSMKSIRRGDNESVQANVANALVKVREVRGVNR